MDKIIGFIGCGNMGKAMVGGIANSSILNSKNILVFDNHKENLDYVRKSFGVSVAKNKMEVAKESDFLFLAVKPNVYSDLINEIKNSIKEDVVIINIAAGKSIENIENDLGKKLKVVKAMPNTPALVGEGMTAISFNDKISNDEKEEILRIFKSFGDAEILEEKLMDVVTATSGSSPAYIFMLIEAMADGAVLNGMKREKAYKIASQAVLGSAKMVLETGKHPGELKDMVCSPGGTTIEAVSSLEKDGFRNAIINAMNICVKKSEKMNNR
ncbi:pyrroline-5-carboxylate reductase [Senegalia massiliensis]|uniref:pyrroline-5-carboxylate reductase n=1 Tax=Senegalia massiliensis TaxID=1720316 RepID=UPI0010301379|nr:pyrroline-5-carboxylate reductase [Senegalia massiliensis]